MPIRLLIALLAATAAAFGTPPAAADEPDDRRRRRTPVVEVFEAARDAVVNISSTELVTLRGRSPFDSLFDEFFQMPVRPRERTLKRTSVGSGFVIHPQGYIVTNAHVVARTAEQTVSFADGREYEATVVAADTTRDVAVLKIEAEAPLPTLPLGRSHDLMVGETVVAIGNPLGFQHTVTSGVVSAVDRAIAINSELVYRDLIQTDASINPGNSGGPLLNVLGELIGVNTAIRGDAQNIGFAIPVDHLRGVLPELLDVERRYRIDTGLTLDNLAEPRVLATRGDSAGARAGIRPGDVLLAVDGRPVREGIDFDIALIDRRPGDVIDLTLRRGERVYGARLELGTCPAPDGARLAAQRLGLEVHPLPEEAVRELGLARSTGLLVWRVEPGGPADEAGIERRDVLLALGRHYVSSVDDLGRLLDPLRPGESVAVRVLRVERRGKVQLSGALDIR